MTYFELLNYFQIFVCGFGLLAVLIMLIIAMLNPILPERFCKLGFHLPDLKVRPHSCTRCGKKMHD